MPIEGKKKYNKATFFLKIYLKLNQNLRAIFFHIIIKTNLNVFSHHEGITEATKKE